MQPLALEHAALPRACVKSSPGMSRTGNSNPGSGGEGTVSFIDPSTAAVKLTFRLPDDGEPMYIAYDYSDRSRILVADRRNDRLVVAELRGDTVELIRRKSRRFLRLPAGAFHSMSSQFFVTEVRQRNFCALS